MPTVDTPAENSRHHAAQVYLESIILRSHDDEQHQANDQEVQNSVLGNSDIDVNPQSEAQEYNLEIQSAPNIPQIHGSSLYMSNVSPRSTPSSVDHIDDPHISVPRHLNITTGGPIRLASENNQTSTNPYQASQICGQGLSATVPGSIETPICSDFAFDENQASLHLSQAEHISDQHLLVSNPVQVPTTSDQTNERSDLTPTEASTEGDVYHQAKTNTEQSEKLPLPDPGGTLTPHQRSLHTRQSNSDLTTVTTASKPTQNKPAANKVLGPETKQELPKETASKKLPK